MSSIFRKILGLVSDIYAKFGPIIDLLAKVDLTKLNNDDRVAFGIAAAEWRQLGLACNNVGDTLDRIKADGISAEEYAELVQALRKVVEEAADIGPATKNLVD